MEVKRRFNLSYTLDDKYKFEFYISKFDNVRLVIIMMVNNWDHAF